MVPYLLVGFACIFGGLLTGYLLRVGLEQARAYDGVIYVWQDEGKITYSLELADPDPEKLQYQTDILFKVEGSDRE